MILQRLNESSDPTGEEDFWLGLGSLVVLVLFKVENSLMERNHCHCQMKQPELAVSLGAVWRAQECSHTDIQG